MMTGNEMMGVAYVLFSIVGIVLSYYILHWLVIEMPVYVRIKHQELYEKQKYPHTNGNK
jgi:hypothetical protein